MTLGFEFHQAFAPIIINIIATSKQCEDPLLKRKLHEAAVVVIQKMTDYPVTLISSVALDVVNKFDVNPQELFWKDRLKFGKPNGKSKIVFEHVVPISGFVRSLFELKCETEIFNSLMAYPGVCVITREEDDRLLNAGFKSSRPLGWRNAYMFCQIDVVKL